MAQWLFRILVLVVGISGLTACGTSGGGGSGGAGAPVDNVVVSIKISPEASLLTTSADTVRLTATAYNKMGVPIIDAAITWNSSHPADLPIDPSTGQVSAQVVGSTLVTASAAVVVSNVATVVVSNAATVVYATPVAGAVLVSDSQILSGPTPLNPTATFGIGSKFTVSVTGITTPTPGTILMGAGDIPLSGQVLSATANGTQTDLTMQVVHLTTLFSDLKINESIDLSQESAVASASAAQYFSMTQQADGSLQFDLRADALDPTTGAFVAPPQLKGTGIGKRAVPQAPGSRFGPFNCQLFGPALIEGIGPVLNVTMPDASGITVTQGLSAAIVYDSNNGGLQSLGLSGKVSANFSSDLTFPVGLDASASCKAELASYTVPLPGPIGFLLSARIPVGVGIELDGVTTLADSGLSLNAQASATVGVSIDCPNGRSCGFNSHLTADGGLTPPLKLPPNVDTLSSNLRLDFTAANVVYADVAIGPPWASILQSTVLQTKSGPSASAKLAAADFQIHNVSYQSDYNLALKSDATLGDGLNEFMGIMGLASFGDPGFSNAITLANSPTLVSATADVTTFAVGDAVGFDVNLNPNNLTFLSDYNVQGVYLYLRTPTGSQEIASIAAVLGQSRFHIPWTASVAGNAADVFVFVRTAWLGQLLPLDKQELGAVNDGGANPQPNLGNISGTWKGTYTCSQGVTGLTLNLAVNAANEITAQFLFYAVAENPGVPSGSYNMTGLWTVPNLLDLAPQAWVIRPQGYLMVPVEGSMLWNQGMIYEGNIPHTGCSGFALKKMS